MSLSWLATMPLSLKPQLLNQLSPAQHFYRRSSLLQGSAIEGGASIASTPGSLVLQEFTLHTKLLNAMFALLSALPTSVLANRDKLSPRYSAIVTSSFLAFVLLFSGHHDLYTGMGICACEDSSSVALKIRTQWEEYGRRIFFSLMTTPLGFYSVSCSRIASQYLNAYRS